MKKKRLCAILLALSLLAGLLTVPTGAADVGAGHTIAASDYLSLVVKEDGSLWACGAQYLPFGESGLRAHPDYTRVMDGVRAVYVFGDDCFAVKTDGSLWGWGRNGTGAMGDGTTEPKTVPVRVTDGVARVLSVGNVTFAVKTDGSLWSWGGGGERPQVPARLMDGVADVAADEKRTYVRRTDGSLWAMTGDVSQLSADAELMKLLDEVARLDGADDHVAAVQTDGTLWALGRDIGVPMADQGGGLYRYAYLSSPKQIDTGVRSVTCTTHTDYYIKEDGSLWLWGGGGISEVPPSAPTPVRWMDGVLWMTSDGSNGFAIKSDRTLWAWGFNTYGELGTGQWQKQAVPVQILSDAADVALGEHHTMALKTDGTLWAWGDGRGGELGDGEYGTLPGAPQIPGQNREHLVLAPKQVLDGVRVTAADPDAPSSWARAEVEAAVSAGLVPEGLQQNYTGAVTRGEAAGLFLRLLEVSAGLSTEELLSEHGVGVDPAAFADTDDPDVLATHALGLINGVGEGKFDPDGTFTRAQIAAILNRAARVLGVETEGYGHAFTDVSGHWAEPELGWPVHAGILSGVGEGRFDPDGVLTTEQAIVMVYRAYEALK